MQLLTAEQKFVRLCRWMRVWLRVRFPLLSFPKNQARTSLQERVNMSVASANSATKRLRAWWESNPQDLAVNGLQCV